jgi:hypothetical protein
LATGIPDDGAFRRLHAPYEAIALPTHREYRFATRKLAASSEGRERRFTMNAVRAVWTNGRILPSEPVDWPEGIQSRVEALAPPGEKTGLSEDEWRDDPDSIAAWIEAVEKIEPLVWAEGEEKEPERWREKCRQFNIEAVRRQRNVMPAGDTP